MNIVAFLSEIGMATAFILGFGVRAFAMLGMIFAAQLYFGLYRHPGEWPWEFIFIIVISWLFYIYAQAAAWASMPYCGARRRLGRAAACSRGFTAGHPKQADPRCFYTGGGAAAALALGRIEGVNKSWTPA